MRPVSAAMCSACSQYSFRKKSSKRSNHLTSTMAQHPKGPKPLNWSPPENRGPPANLSTAGERGTWMTYMSSSEPKHVQLSPLHTTEIPRLYCAI
eukprot:6463374-Amphidinium_carterae.1